MMKYLASLVCLLPISLTPLSAENVLLISIDTLRADRLSCYGYRQNQTPNIDKWATEGVRFENAFSEYPLTLPAHTTILTGTYPVRHGVRENVGFTLVQEQVTLAEIFQQHGYATGAFIGAYVLSSRFGISQGFTTFDEDFGRSPADVVTAAAMERPAEAVANRLLTWLEKHRGRDFFAFVHFFDPHLPRPQGYDPEVSRVDRSIGTIDSYLRSTGLLGKTHIVLVSDHGESLGEHFEAGHGFFLYDATLHVPLIVRPAASLTVPRTPAAHPVSLADVAPTILELSGLKVPPQIQGKSFVKLLVGGAAADTGVYAETYIPQLHFGWSPLRSLRLGRYKFIDAPRPEVYDLVADPAETKNVFAAQQALARQYRERLQQFFSRYGTPHGGEASAHIDRDEAERLAALGYVTLPRRKAQDAFGVGIDPKDRIVAFDAYHQVLNDIANRKVSTRVFDQIDFIRRQAPEIRGTAFLDAQAHEIQGNLGEACERYQSALQEDPENNLARAYLARVMLRLGKNEAAERELVMVLAKDPGDFRSRNNLAGLHRMKGQFEKAIAEMKKAVETEPAYAAGWHNLGQLYGELRDWAAAETALRKTLSLDNKNALAHFHLAYVLNAVGKADEAARHMRVAVELNPSLAK